MEKGKILLFAGTSEGRRLCGHFIKKGIPFDISVATEYGRELLEEDGPSQNHILVNRLSREEMEALIKKNGYALVVDATHPYAVEVTRNIQSACEAAHVSYLRLLRDEGSVENMISCDTVEHAVDFFRTHSGNILSTIGSKELRCFTNLEGYGQRVFARILPLPSAVEECAAMGFQGRNLICMQGPFSYEMNVAMLRQYQCRYLLTKNSGKAGGFDEKIRAARDAGVQVVLIDRPVEENGHSYEEVAAYIDRNWAPGSAKEPELKSHFPFFLPVEGKTALVIGGGAIATRRVKTLCRFPWKITVVSPSATKEIEALALEGRLHWEQRKFLEEDLRGVFLAIAATNSREVNRLAGELAKSLGLYVSVADAREECNCYFPAVAENQHVVAGIVGDGFSHEETAKAAKKIREALA